MRERATCFTPSRSNLRLQAAKNASPGGEHSWLQAFRSLLPWLVPAALSVRVKYLIMSPSTHGGFDIVSRSLGRPHPVQGLGLAGWEKFSFYRADLLVACFLVPLGLVVLSRYLPRRWRAPFGLVVSALATCLLYCQVR